METQGFLKYKGFWFPKHKRPYLFNKCLLLQPLDIKQPYYSNVFLAFSVPNARKNLFVFNDLPVFYAFWCLPSAQGRMAGRRVVVQALQKAGKTGKAFTT